MWSAHNVACWLCFYVSFGFMTPRRQCVIRVAYTRGCRWVCCADSNNVQTNNNVEGFKRRQTHRVRPIERKGNIWYVSVSLCAMVPCGYRCAIIVNIQERSRLLSLVMMIIIKGSRGCGLENHFPPTLRRAPQQPRYLLGFFSSGASEQERPYMVHWTSLARWSP